MDQCCNDREVFFYERDFLDRLNRIYDNIPSGDCNGCAACCMEAVNTFFSEYLNICRLLKASGRFEVFQKAAIHYYLTELHLVQPCPMLMSDKRCGVYEARPLPCRIFGHLSRLDYEANYREIVTQNQAAAKALLSQGIVVPEAVVSRKIDYCEAFKKEADLSTEERDDWVDLLFSLDSQCLCEGLISEEDVNLSLVQWFAYDFFGREEAIKLKELIGIELSNFECSASLLQVMERI